MKELYAEDVNYWKTGQSSPDTWIDKAKAEIKAAGGRVLADAYGSDDTGRAAFMMHFTLGSEQFKLVWPVLPTRTKKEVDQRAAKVQAATMLYHDVKAKAVSAKVHGVKAAFFQYLMLPDGRTASQIATPEIAQRYPRLLTSGDSQ